MSTARHAVVIGAGIVGVSAALHARERGWDVTIIDPRGVAGGASSGNAGVIALSECVPVGTPGTIKAVPRMLLSRDGPLHIRPAYFPRIVPWLLQMLMASTPAKVEQLSIALASILEQALPAHHDLALRSGVHGSIVRSGWLKAYESEASFRGSAGDYDLMRRRGVTCDELDAAGIARLDPALDGHFARAVFHPDCHHVGDPQVYVRALGEHLMRRGAACLADDVVGFDVQGGRVTGVRTRGQAIPADAVVVAAGAWSKPIAALLGCNVPLDTERGYHLMLDASACRIRLRRPLYWAEKTIVIAPMGDLLRVTSSVEFAGIDAKPDYELVLRCLPDVQRLLPGVRLLADSTWLGFRPSIPDSLPVIGPVPGMTNAVLAFGHGHLGLTLGPVTGKLVGALLDGEAPALSLAPFSPARFARRATSAKAQPATAPR